MFVIQSALQIMIGCFCRRLGIVIIFPVCVHLPIQNQWFAPYKVFENHYFWPLKEDTTRLSSWLRVTLFVAFFHSRTEGFIWFLLWHKIYWPSDKKKSRKAAIGTQFGKMEFIESHNRSLSLSLPVVLIAFSSHSSPLISWFKKVWFVTNKSYFP